MKRKRLRALLFILVLLLGLSAQVFAATTENGSLSNFQKETSFTSATFSDIKTSDWFYTDIKAVYELGLMVGDSATTFNPSGNVTLAETVALAARLHAIYYTGKNEFKTGTPWYQAYVDYAKSKQIISTDYKDYSKAATRAEYAVIIAAAFPDEALAEINQVADNAIPDVKISATYGKAVYRLYRAGVLVGSDEKGTYAPNSNIKRSEVAALISRMADPTKRLTKNFGSSSTTTNSPAKDEPSFVIDTVNASAGATNVAVTVAVRNNPGIASVGALISYDSALTLKSIVYNEDIGGQYMLPQTMKNPAKLIWISPFENVMGDWVLLTLYFDVAKNASVGIHQIAMTYNADDIYDITEANINFKIINGAINVTK